MCLLSPSPSSGMAMQSQSQEYVCEAAQTPNPSPTFDAPKWGLGPNLSNTADYARVGQRVLFGVPMAVWVDNDTDLVQGRCRGATGSACGNVLFSELTIAGSFDTSWVIKPPQGQSGNYGSFMPTTGEGASGYFDSQALTALNQDAVVYLPPNNLACGASLAERLPSTLRFGPRSLKRGRLKLGWWMEGVHSSFRFALRLCLVG